MRAQLPRGGRGPGADRAGDPVRGGRDEVPGRPIPGRQATRATWRTRPALNP